MKTKIKIDHIDTVYTTWVDLCLGMDPNVFKYKKCQYDGGYMYQATPKQHLKLNSWES